MSDTLAVERLAATLFEAEVWPVTEDDRETPYAIARAILAADPTLAEALSTGLALQAVQEALPEGAAMGAITPVYNGDRFVEWRAYSLFGRPPGARYGTGPTPTAALTALVDALNKEKGR